MVIFKDNGQGYDNWSGDKKPKPNRTDGKKNRHFLRQRFPYHWNHQITIGPLWYRSAKADPLLIITLEKNSDIGLV